MSCDCVKKCAMKHAVNDTGMMSHHMRHNDDLSKHGCSDNATRVSTHMWILINMTDSELVYCIYRHGADY